MQKIHRVIYEIKLRRSYLNNLLIASSTGPSPMGPNVQNPIARRVDGIQMD